MPNIGTLGGDEVERCLHTCRCKPTEMLDRKPLTKSKDIISTLKLVTGRHMPIVTVNNYHTAFTSNMRHAAYGNWC